MTDAYEVSSETIAAEAERQRVFRRALAAAGLFILAFAGVRIWWGIVAERRLQSEIDRIHAAGEPVFANDYPPTKTLPEGGNAADEYLRAQLSINKDPRGALTYNDAIDRPRAIEKYPDEIEQIVLANQEALDIVRQARHANDVEWNVQAVSPLINIMLSHVSNVRMLGAYLRVAARYHTHKGNSNEAFEIVRDGLLMADRLEQSESFHSIITRLAAARVARQSLIALELLTPNLAVAGTNSADDETQATRREDVNELIRQLLNDEPILRSYEKALCTERAIGVDSLDLVLKRGAAPGMAPFFPSSTVVSLVARPAIRLDSVRMIQRIDATRAAGLSGKWSNVEMNGEADNRCYKANIVDRMSHLYSNLLTPSLTRATESTYRDIAFRRMAAIALAIRLYEIDHGNRPVELAELVPDYLPSVPADPFDDNGGAIRYLPEGSPALLYSIARNQVDEQGRHLSADKPRVNENLFDIPYFLDGDRPYEAMPDRP